MAHDFSERPIGVGLEADMTAAASVDTRIREWLRDQQDAINARLHHLAQIIAQSENTLQQARMESLQLSGQLQLITRQVAYLDAPDAKPVAAD